MAGLQGDLRAAATLIQEGRALANQSREPMLQAHIDLADGYRALFSGELDNARGLFDHAADVYAEHNNELFEVVTIGVLGLTHELLDETERAIECYERGLAIAEVRGETVYRSYTLWPLRSRYGDTATAPARTNFCGRHSMSDATSTTASTPACACKHWPGSRPRNRTPNAQWCYLPRRSS